MDHVVTYFGPKECLSKQKRYIRYKMEKTHKLVTRRYVGLVRHLNSRMAQMPPMFDKNQKLDESELVDSLSKKAPRSHKAMLILQGFNPETGYLENFVEHCEQAEITDNISVAKFSASYENSDTKRHKKCSKFKEREDNGKKHRKKNSSLYCSLHGENKSHTSRECNILKKRAKDKENPKYGKSIKRRSSKNLISCRHKLPTKSSSMKN